MLTRLLQKVQRFVIQNPTIAMTLYTSFNEIFNSEVEKLKEPQIGSSKVVPTVKNPLIVHGKGRPTNKRIKSIVELVNKTKKKNPNENAIPQVTIQPTHEIQTQPPHETQTQPLHEIQIQPLHESQIQPLYKPSHEIQTQSLHKI